MMAPFAAPVLSVAADVVQELDGEDALYGLWALFTKCKESLKDGRRLENISWRLWYREIAQHAPSPGSLSPLLSEKEAISPTPITPTSDDGRTHTDPDTPLADADGFIPAHSWHGDVARLAPAPSRRLSVASAPPPALPGPCVGKLIINMLPRGLTVSATQPARAACQSQKQSQSQCSTPQATRASPTTPRLAHPRPVVAVPLTAGATPPAPRVVVVNPTPHPTPPATPSLHRASGGAAPTHSQPPAHPPPQTQPPAPPPAPAIAPHAPPPARDPPGVLVPPREDRDATLRPSDRRFFLQGAGDSPEQDSPSASSAGTAPGLPPSPGAGAGAGDSREAEAEAEVHAQSVGSAASSESRAREGGAGAGTRSQAHAQQKKGALSARMQQAAAVAGKRGREQPHRAHARAAVLHRTHTQPHLAMHRAAAAARKAHAGGGEGKKTTFNIGSVSSNGSSGMSKAQREKEEREREREKEKEREKEREKEAREKEREKEDREKEAREKEREKERDKAERAKQSAIVNATANGKAAPQPPKRRIMMSTSSEYDTTDTEDDESEWADEGASADEREREKEEQRRKLQAAAEEAERQRSMFAKVPPRSYSNLGQRTQSGLLSQLLNPDPNTLPPGHPARRGFSSQDVTQFGRRGAPAALPTSKSSVAVPLAAAVTAQAPPSTPTQGAPRPKPKRPKSDVEMEEDSESEGEDADSGLQLSRSLAQQRLAALADPARRRHSDRGPAPAEPPRPAQLTSVATAPIPLGHPYNLPAPAPPMTPRTTRRQMLSTELSESLRRNLLWERQVSRNNMTGARRGGVLGGAVRPLTALNANGDVRADAQKSSLASRSEHGDELKDERKQRRNRSWADDYHYAGW